MQVSIGLVNYSINGETISPPNCDALCPNVGDTILAFINGTQVPQSQITLTPAGNGNFQVQIQDCPPGTLTFQLISVNGGSQYPYYDVGAHGGTLIIPEGDSHLQMSPISPQFTWETIEGCTDSSLCTYSYVEGERPCACNYN